jgi:hypothetical protein
VIGIASYAMQSDCFRGPMHPVINCKAVKDSALVALLDPASPRRCKVPLHESWRKPWQALCEPKRYVDRREGWGTPGTMSFGAAAYYSLTPLSYIKNRNY